MPLSSSSKENISLKKLVGKAHTSNFFEAFNESKSTGITISSAAVIANDIPESPSSTNLYDITSNVVEYVRLVATPLNESINDNNKYHAFKLSLPADYETDSSFVNAGTGSFVNSQDLYDTNGKLQLVPPSFFDSYEAKVYYGGNDTKASGTRIPLLDDRSWYLDYFNGVLFQETPPNDASENPSYVEAYVYVGKMASERFSESSGGGGGAGASSLNELSDVTIGNIPLGQDQILVYTADNVFENKTFSSTQLSDSGSLLRTSSSISDLNDVTGSLSGIQDGNVLAWSSSKSKFEFVTPAVTYTDEEARDAVGIALVSGSHSGISFVSDDDNNVINATISLVSSSIGDLSNVDISGIVNNNILKWNSASGSFVVSTDTGRTPEEIQDLVGEMLVSGSHTDINITYDDNLGLINISASGSLARINSPEFTGTPLAPTATLGSNSTQIATTAFVQTGLTNLSSSLSTGIDEVNTSLTNLSSSLTNLSSSLSSEINTLDTSLTSLSSSLSSEINTLDTSLTSLSSSLSSEIDALDTSLTSLSASLSSSYQPLDNGLTSISSLVTQQDQIIYTTGEDLYTTSSLTQFARSILDDENAESVRLTLGLGTAALSGSNDFLSSSSGINDLSDVLINNVSNSQILIYDADSDNKWKNVTVTGSLLISNSGVATIQENSVTNNMIASSSISITDGTNTDNLELGETLTFEGNSGEITVEVSGSDSGSKIILGLPDDVTIPRDLDVTRNLTVTGDLTVNGVTTTISTTNLDVEDSVISLNHGLGQVENTKDVGFYFDRGSLRPALVFWDEGDDVFKIGTHSTGSINTGSIDLGSIDDGFSYESLKAKTVVTSSNDNSVATTEWVTTKVSSSISATSINDLVDVDTTGKSAGKLLKFDASGNLVVADGNGFTADTSSLWDVSDDGTELYPHGIIDGTLDTGMFAINLSAGSLDFTDLNVTLYDVLEELSSMNSYTPSTRDQNSISDTYFEFDGDGNIMPKAAS